MWGASTPSALIAFCPSARVPAKPLPTLLCTHGPSSRAVTILSGLGDVCSWKTHWGREGSLDCLRWQEAKYIYLALNSEARYPLLPTWHVQTVTSPVICYLMRPFWKLGKPDLLLTTPASPKKVTEIYDKELPWLRPNALVLGNHHSWLPGWNSPKERTTSKAKRKGKDMALVCHPSCSHCPFSSHERRKSWLKDLNSGSDISCCNSLHHPCLVTPCSLIFMLSPGQTPKQGLMEAQISAQEDHLSTFLGLNFLQLHCFSCPNCYFLVVNHHLDFRG